MEFDILAYNNNNNNSGSNSNNINTNRPTKISKLENDLSNSKIVFSNVGCYNDDDHMLSFNNSSNNGSWVNGCHYKSSFYNNGYSCSEGNMSASMYAMSGGVKGLFTTSQWIELEQQAMIYKYIIANEPIPPNLLISITRAFESACFSSYNAGFLRPNSFGWGPFHLGYSNSTDPEPGRCRRTDGKKWRCSRDAVPDHKYCERHMNRGRHRSRKPVEGQFGHSTSRTNTSKTNIATNLVNTTSPSSSLVVPGGGSSNSFAITLNQNKDLHPVTRLDFTSPSISLNSSGNTFPIDKDQNRYSESAGAGGFAGLKCDSLVNPVHKNPYGSASYDLNVQESNPRNSDQSSLLWQTQPDNPTQLSISIPVPLPADFMSSTSTPTSERVTPISPLRLSRAFNTYEMGLDVSTVEQSEKRPNWVPISWETSMGGPLGEVLKTSSNSSEDHKKNNTSSPNNVLQMTALCSLSSNSGGSSAQAENVGCCNVRLG